MVQAQITRTDQGSNAGRRGGHGVDDWLAEELHDGVAQSLWYLGIELSALNQEISPSEARLREQVRTLGEVAQEAYAQVRAILGQTWSPAGSAGTLDSLVRREAQSFEDRTEVSIRLDLEEGSLSVSPEQSHHVAAILREALCNAWRHGKAKWVQVELKAAEGTAYLTVRDRGVGFHRKVREEGHYGIATMQKRAQALGGVLEVTSRVGKGTRVSLAFPLEVPDGQSRDMRCSNGRSHISRG